VFNGVAAGVSVPEEIDRDTHTRTAQYLRYTVFLDKEEEEKAEHEEKGISRRNLLTIE